jgi:two-component system response regulator FixJ
MKHQSDGGGSHEVDFFSASRPIQSGHGLSSNSLPTDVRMPEMTGLDLVRRLNDLGAVHPVIVITGHADVPLAVEAMKAGVVDFIEKPFDDEKLLAAIRIALRRGEHDEQEASARKAVQDRLNSLSGREREVLTGLVAGQANKLIAYDLGISPRTVEVYRANVMTKMQVSSLSDLVRLTLRADRT